MTLLKNSNRLLFAWVLVALLASPVWAWQNESKPTADPAKQAEKPAEQSAEGQTEQKKSDDEVSEAKTPATRSARSTRSRRESALVRVSRSGSQFLSIFEPIVAETVPATVKIKKGKTVLALGAIVDPEGFVLTKQSELRNPLSVEFSDGSTASAYVYGVHQPTDLALLKIVDASQLPSVRWSSVQSPEIGTWLATVSLDERPLSVGVVGVLARKIKPPRGFMGVNLEVNNGNVVILAVSEKTPAERAGVQAGDIVLQINETTVNTIPELQEIVGNFPPGETIRMTVNRNDKKVVLEITLGNAETLNPMYERSNQQNTMGSTLSQRRSDFPLAVQHDSALESNQCGGPVVDIDGNVIGINIARRGRVSSLMLPVSLVIPVIEELKSGQLAPALVHKSRIEEINRMLRELQSTLDLGPIDKSTLETNLQELSDAEKKAQMALDTALKQLKKVEKDKHKAEFELEQAKQKLSSAKREKERLEKEREKLVSGTR